MKKLIATLIALLIIIWLIHRYWDGIVAFNQGAVDASHSSEVRQQQLARANFVQHLTEEWIAEGYPSIEQFLNREQKQLEQEWRREGCPPQDAFERRLSDILFERQCQRLKQVPSSEVRP